MRGWFGYRGALAFTLALALPAFFPLIFQDHVLSPHDQAHYIQAAPAEQAGPRSTFKFSDLNRAYVPELNQQLVGEHESWLSTWNPYVQLGRPTYHTSGLSKAYPLTLLLSAFVREPFRLYTCLSLATLVLSAFFFFQLFKAHGLHPIACAAGSAAWSYGFYAAFWLTAVAFLATLCWTACILWLSRLLADRPSAWAWLGLAFGCYSLGLAGYPQHAVYQAYVIVPYVAVVCWRAGGTAAQRLSALARIATAALAGLLACTPFFLDLALTASRSARLEAPLDFFTEGLPRTGSWREVAAYLSELIDAFLEGNPIDTKSPRQLRGISATPSHALVLVLSLLVGIGRRAWPWQLALGIGLVLSLSKSAFAFGIDHLGFHLSRSNPLIAGVVPGVFLVALTLDRLFRNGGLAAWRAAVGALLVMLLALGPFLGRAEALDRSAMLVALGLVALTSWLAVRPGTLVAAIWIAACGLAYAPRLVLHQPAESIRRDSRLLQEIRRQTADGSRFALIAPAAPLLSPNSECFYRVHSIHSYDSLSSQAYQDLVERLSSEGTRHVGRLFAEIADASRLSQEELRLAGVALVMSFGPVSSPVLEPLIRIGGVFLYRPRVPPLLRAQIASFSREAEGRAAFSPRSAGGRDAVTVLGELDDHLRLKVEPRDEETLLFLSRQYHPHWMARSGGKELQSVCVNGFYQGVILPAGSVEVELSFLPWIRWAWIPEAFFALLGAGCLARSVVQRWRRRISS